MCDSKDAKGCPVEEWMLGKDRVAVVSYIDGKVETIRDEVCRGNANRDLGP